MSDVHSADLFLCAWGGSGSDLWSVQERTCQVCSSWNEACVGGAFLMSADWVGVWFLGIGRQGFAARVSRGRLMSGCAVQLSDCFLRG